jgi:hypothetical protein
MLFTFICLATQAKSRTVGECLVRPVFVDEFLRDLRKANCPHVLAVGETPASLNSLPLNHTSMIAENSLQGMNQPPQGGNRVKPVSNRVRRLIWVAITTSLQDYHEPPGFVRPKPSSSCVSTHHYAGNHRSLDYLKGPNFSGYVATSSSSTLSSTYALMG